MSKKEENKKEIHRWRFLILGSVLGIWIGLFSNYMYYILFLQADKFWQFLISCLFIFLPPVLFFASTDSILKDLGFKPAPKEPFFKGMGGFLRSNKGKIIVAIVLSIFSALVLYMDSMKDMKDGKDMGDVGVEVELYTPERFRGPVTKV